MSGAPRILVVDDHPEVRKVAARMLDRAGYDVRTAEDFSAATDVVDAAAPELVLTDLELPDRDGVELLAYLDDAAPDTAVLVMTANHWRATDLASEGLPVLEKPFSREQLVDLVQRLLGDR